MAKHTISIIAALQTNAGIPLGVRPGKTPTWLYPIRWQREYQFKLVTMVKEIQTLYTETVLSQTEQIFKERDVIAGRADNTRADDGLDNLNTLNNTFNIQAQAVKDARFLQVTGGIPRGIENFNGLQWAKIIRAKFGIPLFTTEPWLAPMLKAWGQQNSLLITGMLDDQRKNVESIVLRNFSNGQRHTTMIGEIQDSFGVTQNRARLLARDQTNKLNGDMMKQRQEDVGLTHYFWRDSDDKRVRTSHQGFDGKRYSWDPQGDDRAPEGNPGQPIQCRCWGDPDFSVIDEELKEVA